MQRLSRTALIHPTMIAKIRRGMYYASKGQGHMMNGHGKRVYITNAQGRNIMRLDWVGGRMGYIVYGQESVNITRTVRNALASVVARELLDPLPMVKPTQNTEKTNVLIRQRVAVVAKMSGISALGLLLTGCTTVQGWLV